MQLRRLYQVGSRRSKSTVVVLPRDVLNAAGLAPGDYVRFEAVTGCIRMEKIRTDANPDHPTTGASG